MKYAKSGSVRVILPCVLLAAVVFAGDGKVTELVRLEAQYGRETAKLTAEYDAKLANLDKGYAAELEKLKNRLVQAGRLDDALVVKEAINKHKAKLGSEKTPEFKGTRPVADAIVGRWYYKAENTTFSREFTKDRKFILRRKDSVEFTGSYTVDDDGAVVAKTGNGIEMRHVLKKDGRLDVEGSYIAERQN